MDKLPDNPILEFNSNQLMEVRKTFGYEDLNKLVQALDLMQKWIAKQAHFVVRDFDRSFLERYIMANKGSVERAKKRLDRLCTMRTLMPEFLMNFDIKHEFEALFKCSYQGVLPKPTPDNYRVLYCQVHDYEKHKDVELINFYRSMIMILEYMLHHDYNVGYEVIMDIQVYSIGIVSKLNPIIIHKALTIFTEAYGLRMKAVHMIIGGSKVFETILSIFKQGMSAKLSRRMIIHTTTNTLLDYFPKRILPKDYGGDEKFIKELNENICQVIMSDSHESVMKKMQQAVTDESCRSAGSFNEEYSGMPGSFKTLCVD